MEEQRSPDHPGNYRQRFHPDSPVGVLGCFVWVLCPVGDWLGVHEKYSPGVREMVCRVGLDGSYRNAAEDLQRLSQIRLSYHTDEEIFFRAR